MQITHVIRGEDHISNTPRQLLLYEAFGWKAPTFAHVSLVMGPDHSPLSKRHGATSVAEFRARGILPEALTNYLSLIGWSPGADEELLPVDELAARFRLEDVGHSAGVFDVEKLAWVNRHYLKGAAPERLARLALPYLHKAGWVSEPSPDGISYLETVVSVAAASVDRLEQIPARLAFLFDYSTARALADPAIAQEARDARAVIDALAREMDASPPLLDRDTFRALAKKVQQASGAKGKALFHPIRLALTGEAEGIELDLAVPAIERGALLERSGITVIPGARGPRCRVRRGVGRSLVARMVIYGINPVLEALRAGRVTSLRVGRRGDSRVQELLMLAGERGITVQRVEPDVLDRLARGGVHQGVVAEAAEAASVDYSVDELVRGARGRALIVVLDGIEDPHNLGAILRTADAAGVDGVVVQNRRAAALDGAAVKASAGAVAHVKIAQVVNIARAIDELKELGVWTVGLAGEADTMYDAIDYTVPTAVVVGAEGSGLRRLVRETCDFTARIPMHGRVSSLNVSVATGVVLFEAVRQRAGSGGPGQDSTIRCK